MPCDSRIPAGMTAETRKRQIDAAIDRLEAALTAGGASVKIGQNGALAFQGWTANDGVSDVCAFRALSKRNSFALRRAIATAEARAGRKLDGGAIAAGHHSHDGGTTWSTH